MGQSTTSPRRPLRSISGSGTSISAHEAYSSSHIGVTGRHPNASLKERSLRKAPVSQLPSTSWRRFRQSCMNERWGVLVISNALQSQPMMHSLPCQTD
ncbi:hypothetical protein V5799_022048 [Amblyomma americanum]|uniref:Uncharacterized protein n=1 Tax=Amblyomma americanum TaxID=6943 RepID=A0AAQ4FNN5_AMBAM